MQAVESVPIELPSDGGVTGLLQTATQPLACYVLAHGAGAGMHHPFLAEVAEGLAERRISTLRYQFPYMEHGGKRPDRAPLAHVTVRAAVAAAATLTQLPLFAGGKSFGGRMTSQAQAQEPLAGVRGLVFLGFPLHPPDVPAAARADHLANVHVPLLFLQGERDRLASPDWMAHVVARLGPSATLAHVAHADHGFDVLVRSGRTHAGVMAEVLDTLAAWVMKQLGSNASSQ